MKTSSRSRIWGPLVGLLLFLLVACDATTPTGQPGAPRDGDPDVGTIDLRDAAALGVATSRVNVGLSSSPLVTAEGDLHVVKVSDSAEVEAVADGGHTFRDFEIIDGRVFLIALEPFEYGCVLVEVIDGTTVECIDDHLFAIDEIDIGSDGAIYYRGWATETGDTVDGFVVLMMRGADGTTTKLFDGRGPLSLYDWGVAADGLVYLSGNTVTESGAGARWIRRRDPDGSVPIIAEGEYRADFLGRWPDGNLYLMGNWGMEEILRIHPDEDVISEVPYSANATHAGRQQPLYDTTALNLPIAHLEPDDLQYFEGRVVAVVEGYGDGSFVAMELYPEPRLLESVLLEARSVASDGTDFYFAGRADGGIYRIVKLDALTGENTVLYETVALELFEIALKQDRSAILIDAFEPSTNQYVLATLDLGSGEVTTEALELDLAKLQPLN